MWHCSWRFISPLHNNFSEKNYLTVIFSHFSRTVCLSFFVEHIGSNQNVFCSSTPKNMHFAVSTLLTHLSFAEQISIVLRNETNVCDQYGGLGVR